MRDMLCTCSDRQAFPTTMLLDGVERRVVWPASAFIGTRTFNPHSGAYYEFFLDSDSLPGRPCSGHSLPGTALAHICKGYWVKSSGHQFGGKAPATTV